MQVIANEDVPYAIPYFYNSLDGVFEEGDRHPGDRPRPLLPAGRPASSSDQCAATGCRSNTNNAGGVRSKDAPVSLHRRFSSGVPSSWETGMARFLIKRLASAIVTLWLLATIVFLIVNVLPGDIGRKVLGAFAPKEEVATFNARLGTDKPLIEQYATIDQERLHPRLRRLVPERQTVTEIVGEALFRSGKLALLALVITVPLAIAAGVFAAEAQGQGRRSGGRDDGPGDVVDSRVRHRRGAHVAVLRDLEVRQGVRQSARRGVGDHPVAVPLDTGARHGDRVFRLHRPNGQSGGHHRAPVRLRPNRHHEGPLEQPGDEPPHPAQRARRPPSRW